MNLSTDKRWSVADRASVFLGTGLCLSMLPTTLLQRFQHRKEGQNLIERKWTGAGLIGSFEGAATYFLLPARIANAWWAVAAGLALAVAISGRAERALASHDDSRIVIDEWIGAWIALWGAGQRIAAPAVLGFVLFRFFDVLKGPIGRRLQAWPGGWGVTMDDVYAGVAANLVWRISVAASLISH